MAERISVGLNYSFNNQTNSGVVNYVYNIIAALKTLPDANKPRILVLYSNGASIDYLQAIDYPYIQFKFFAEHPKNNLLQKLNRLILKLSGSDFYKYIRYFRHIDVLYPYFSFRDAGLEKAPNKIHWLVDFNPNVFPNHYEPEHLDRLMVNYKEVTSDPANTVVLSSQALYDELKKYYPHHHCTVRVLRFASVLPDISMLDKHKIFERYKISDEYFMSPNQFWEHKNQLVVLEALCIIKKKHPELPVKVYFTGSLEVHRNKGFYADIFRLKIEEYKLQDEVQFLGVIERNEQLLLMADCRALIQPSLYEGWSTLVEEAKALNKHILLSRLPVHEEQIHDNVSFFNPLNPEELSHLMLQQLLAPAEVKATNYRLDIENYGKQLLKLFKETSEA